MIKVIIVVRRESEAANLDVMRTVRDHVGSDARIFVDTSIVVQFDNINDVDGEQADEAVTLCEHACEAITLDPDSQCKEAWVDDVTS